ncbi:NitT/TauT family transport system permease protein [Thermocatellispora tengchongensis]|uniref:NitT/TauT family transport system permease protein n=1 Tax=Thermocatellispora tengchongensis TaxID=1073253 RepID=A0A840PQI8_9ACTN|nr:ABC transporter permease subunit [Thermocatellispora tengchongensis]MBB5138255.1 NitT/TauT family transport system permease protein [Thermocatellispora tengchongensis]
MTENSRTRLVRGVIGAFAAAAVAEALTRLGVVDVAPVTEVAARFFALAADPGFLANALDTILAWALGLALATLAAVALGVLLGSVPFLGRASEVVVEFLRPIPSVALIPLAILLFEGGTDMKVALIVYAASWPILLNTLYALRDVDPLAKDALRSFGFGPLSVLWRVSLPSAAPFVATGVRVAAGIALVVVVAAELLDGGESGIGVVLIEARSTGGSTDVMLAVAFWAGLFGLAVNALLVRAERVAFRWHAVRAGEPT